MSTNDDHDLPWHAIIDAKALMGAYHGKPPRLSSFAPHGARCELGQIALAGQFMDLPSPAPPTWEEDGVVSAYAVFSFAAVRRFEQHGTFEAAGSNDSLHYRPVGVTGECVIEHLMETFMVLEAAKDIRWKRFSFKSSGTSFCVEAGLVQLYVGRQAFRQFGWPEGV